MMAAADAEQFEAAARLRDQLSTVHQLQEKQRIATAELNDDADVFGYHFEDDSLAVNLFHVRNGKIVDRREFFWEDLPSLPDAVGQNPPDGARTEDAPSLPTASSSARVGSHDIVPNTSPFDAGAVFSALLKQLYIDQQYVPRSILVPVDFDDRETLAALLTERTGHKIEIAVPQRGDKKSLVDLAAQNAHQSYTQRFRVLEPSRKAIQEALADTLMLPELPRRIECFDISHIQGAETVASLVVWEDGKMNKSAYRKFKVKTVAGVDDFASMREVIERRYRRIRDSGNDSLPRRGGEKVAQGASPGLQPQIMSQAPEGRQKLDSVDRNGESSISEGLSGKSSTGNNAIAHPRRRRPWPASRCGRRARITRLYFAAAGFDCKTRRSHLPLRQ